MSSWSEGEGCVCVCVCVCDEPAKARVELDYVIEDLDYLWAKYLLM